MAQLLLKEKAGRTKNNNWVPDRLSLFVVVMVCAIANTPYFLNSYYPVHDTLSVFQFFSYYYDELIFNKTFPWWMPLTSYGMPIDPYILFSLGPFQYLALIIGYLFNIKNVLHLFSASLAFDSLLLGVGALVFCRNIFKDTFSALVCTISLLLLIFYDRQIYWNFKILVPLPLVMFLAQRGIEKLNPIYLLWAASVLLCCSFGSVTYALVAQIYIIVIYCLIFLISSILLSELQPISYYWARFQENTIRKESLLLALPPTVTILIGLIVMYSIRAVMNRHMDYNALGRHSNLGVDLKTYLSYGGNGGTDKLFEIFNGLPTSNPHDFLTYIGLINFGFVLIGLISMKKDPSQIALLFTVAIVVAFTITTTGVAELAYSLPGMNFIRHIAYFITVGKLLLIIFAGFGIKFLLRRDNTIIKYLCLIFSGIIALLFTPLNKPILYNIHAEVVSIILISFVFFTWIFKVPIRIFVLGCVFISLADIVSYRIVIFKMADLFLVAFPNEFKIAHPPPNYHPIRIEEGDADVLKRFRIKPMDIYGIGDSYLREDFCKGSRQDIISKGVKQLFQLRVWRDRVMTEPRDALSAHGDQVLKKVLGCNVPKLRMVSNVKYAQSDVIAAQLICCQANIFDHPVITVPKSERIDEHVNFLSTKDTASVKYFSANKIIINVHNSEKIPLWLIYADAFDERWKAIIDNMPQPLYRANIAFKAIKIEPGTHEIMLSLYRPLMNIIFFIFALIMSGMGIYMISILLWCFKCGSSEGKATNE